MIRTFKVLSLLLTYPTAELKAAAPELAAALDAEALLPERLRARLAALIGEIAARDLYDLQERYVLLFDRTRSLSLHLFEHVHGEGRDRGQAMVDLIELYERGGLRLEAKELPDYLPLFLEFLSTRPFGEAQDLHRSSADGNAGTPGPQAAATRKGSRRQYTGQLCVEFPRGHTADLHALGARLLAREDRDVPPGPAHELREVRNEGLVGRAFDRRSRQSHDQRALPDARDTGTARSRNDPNRELHGVTRLCDGNDHAASPSLPYNGTTHGLLESGSAPRGPDGDLLFAFRGRAASRARATL